MSKVLTEIEKRIGKKYIPFFRFLLVGGFVTIISFVLIYIFLKIIGTPLIITYVFLYITTILISYLLNSRFTFRAKRDISGLIFFYGSYVFTLVIGAICLSLFRKWLPFENWILAFLVVPITMITNFILSSLIFKNKKIRKYNEL
jgi:putative flippase GtrA